MHAALDYIYKAVQSMGPGEAVVVRRDPCLHWAGCSISFCTEYLLLQNPSQQMIIILEDLERSTCRGMMAKTGHVKSQRLARS
jgi:hypothetical protein